MSETEQGTKHDGGKTRLDLLDSAFIEGVGAVLEFGSRKYAANNWRKGLAVSRCLGAALRHIFAVLRGETLDKESGLPHLHHSCCAIMFADSMLRTRPDLDDRWKETPELKGCPEKMLQCTHCLSEVHPQYPGATGGYCRYCGKEFETKASPTAPTCPHDAWYDKRGIKDCVRCGERLPPTWGPVK